MLTQNLKICWTIRPLWNTDLMVGDTAQRVKHLPHKHEHPSLMWWCPSIRSVLRKHKGTQRKSSLDDVGWLAFRTHHNRSKMNPASIRQKERTKSEWCPLTTTRVPGHVHVSTYILPFYTYMYHSCIKQVLVASFSASPKLSSFHNCHGLKRRPNCAIHEWINWYWMSVERKQRPKLCWWHLDHRPVLCSFQKHSMTSARLDKDQTCLAPACETGQGCADDKDPHKQWFFFKVPGCWATIQTSINRWYHILSDTTQGCE